MIISSTGNHRMVIVFVRNRVLSFSTVQWQNPSRRVVQLGRGRQQEILFQSKEVKMICCHGNSSRQSSVLAYTTGDGTFHACSRQIFSVTSYPTQSLCYCQLFAVVLLIFIPLPILITFRDACLHLLTITEKFPLKLFIWSLDLSTVIY